MGNVIKIKTLVHATHDMLRIVTEKPAGISFHPGQAADISINQPGWQDQLRAFTFTCLPDDSFLEFTIKTYPERKGVTNQLLSLQAGDELIIGDVFGDINYKGEGIFIAGGAGITPFVSILRSLEKQNKLGKNKLIFANKTKADIVYEDMFRKLLGQGFINILSAESLPGYEHGFVSADLIKKVNESDLKYYYLCGPDPMMQAVSAQLSGLGVDEDHLIREGF